LIGVVSGMKKNTNGHAEPTKVETLKYLKRTEFIRHPDRHLYCACCSVAFQCDTNI